MNKNLIGELRIMRDFGIKPNFTELGRRYNIDRHTIKKYYDLGEIPKRKEVSRKSKYDPYCDEIAQMCQIDGITISAIFQRMKHIHTGEISWNYNSLKHYIRIHGLKSSKNQVPHVLYETAPGEQLQVDWKESMKMTFKNGETIVYNVFSATLGHSREHIFIYSRTKTTEDFLFCMIKVLKAMGGVPKTVVTDNMSAIVKINGHKKKVINRVSQFFKDMGCKLILCKVKTPETKGKDENANKFVKWIEAYQNSLESEEELIDIIENVITSQANSQINTGTGVPPSLLFKKEKEHLNPLPSASVLDSYINEHYVQTVDSTLLVYCRGNKYSVPPECLNKSVELYVINDTIEIYLNKKLVTIHTITQNRVNYKEEHYKAAYASAFGNSKDIEERALLNLKRLETLGI